MGVTPQPDPVHGGQSWLPVPDPTVLTTNIVNQAKEDLRRELGDVQRLLEARFSRAEKVLEHLQVEIVEHCGFVRELWEQALQAERDLRVSEHQALKDVVNERAIATRDALGVAVTNATRVSQLQQEAAVAAANKSEVSFIKAIDQIAELLRVQGEAQAERTNALSSRIDREKAGLRQAPGPVTGSGPVDWPLCP